MEMLRTCLTTAGKLGPYAWRDVYEISDIILYTVPSRYDIVCVTAILARR